MGRLTGRASLQQPRMNAARAARALPAARLIAGAPRCRCRHKRGDDKQRQADGAAAGTPGASEGGAVAMLPLLVSAPGARAPADPVAEALKGNEALLSEKARFSARLTDCACFWRSASAGGAARAAVLTSGHAAPRPAQELALVRMLVKRGQAHIFAGWPAPGARGARRT